MQDLLLALASLATLLFPCALAARAVAHTKAA